MTTVRLYNYDNIIQAEKKWKEVWEVITKPGKHGHQEMIIFFPGIFQVFQLQRRLGTLKIEVNQL